MGLSQKRLLRKIVLSATYRQDSVVTAEKLKLDPRNRWLSRGPRFRLSSESIRDQALAVSGLLHSKIGGPSVMPTQPDGVWKSTYSNLKWVNAKGKDQFRRGLYTYWKRTSPYPSMITFDAGRRSLPNSQNQNEHSSASTCDSQRSCLLKRSECIGIRDGSSGRFSFR